MKESYGSSIAVHAGNVWIKHGSVSSMNVLDGYRLSEFPDPGVIGKIQASPDGTFWCWTGQHLSRYHHSRWESFDVDRVTRAGFLRSNPEQQWIFTSKVSPDLQSPIWVVGIDAEHALILLPDQVLEFEAFGKTSSVVLASRDTGLGRFTSRRRESDVDIWITGQGGLGQLSPPDRRWRECVQPPVGYTDLREPFEGEGGEVFVSAIDPSSRAAVLRLNGAGWRFVYRGQWPDIRGWRGAEQTVWIQDRNRLLHLTSAGRAIPVERSGPLSGIVLSIKTERSKRFWVATSQGLAMYMPPLWRTPPDTQHIDEVVDEVVNAITEDKHGRVWFLSPHLLMCLDGRQWDFFPLPKHETAWTDTAEGLAALPDGTIAVQTTSPHLLTFDPKRRRFYSVKHPAGRDTRLFIQQPDGFLLVQTIGLDSPAGFALETFDGREFHPYLNPGSSWGITYLRSVLAGDNDEIWAGGSDGFGVYRNGSFSHVGTSAGFTDSGVFSLKRAAGEKLLAGGREGLFAYDGKAWHSVLRGLDRVRNITTAGDWSLWIASGTGINRLQDGKQTSHGIEEGLPSNVALRVFEDSRGRVWAGTSRGLSLLHPDADPDPPTTQISAAQNARETLPGGRVRLVFSGVDKWKFTQSERLLFSWRMDGGNWSAFTGATSESLDKLLPGEHEFEARAIDRNGNIDPHPPAYGFTVLPSWYQTTGFRYLTGASVLMIILLLGFAVANYRLLLRKRKLKSDRQEILEMVARREPLEGILQRVVLAIASNQQGAIGAALQYGNGVLQFLAFSEPPVQLTHTAGHWTAAKDGGQRNLALNLDHGLTVQIRSGKQEILGAMVAIFPWRARRTVADLAMLEALGGIASLAIENARLHDQLDHHAHHDLLTGLPNRWSIDSELQATVRDARDNRQSVALLFLDIDRFKHVNDSLGHGAGDSFLGQIAARLILSIPDGAMAARTGGDEFIVVLTQQNEKPEVERTALLILEALRAPLTVEGNELFPSISMGISMFPQDSGDAVTLQRHADLAMYRGKSQGKNCCEFFSQDIGDSAAQAMAMEQVLRKALDEGWLELYYQAQFNQLEALAGMEALVRLHHPVLGLVGPSEFIALSEETGLIHRVGEWVLREACREIRCWQGAGCTPVKIAVNVSALQFRQPSFAVLVGHILDEMQIDPRLIELELTESMIMENYEESAGQMRKLRSLGLSIAVDDLGTGYCSLAHLHRLPIDVLKIDQSFVREIHLQSSTRSLVQAIVGLARNLNLSVVAEGVETEYQRTALHDIGCDVLQGYLLHRPQIGAEIEQLLLTQTSARILLRLQSSLARPVEPVAVSDFWLSP